MLSSTGAARLPVDPNGIPNRDTALPFRMIGIKGQTQLSTVAITYLSKAGFICLSLTVSISAQKILSTFLILEHIPNVSSHPIKGLKYDRIRTSKNVTNHSHLVLHSSICNYQTPPKCFLIRMHQIQTQFQRYQCIQTIII